MNSSESEMSNGAAPVTSARSSSYACRSGSSGGRPTDSGAGAGLMRALRSSSGSAPSTASDQSSSSVSPAVRTAGGATGFFAGGAGGFGFSGSFTTPNGLLNGFSFFATRGG